MLYIELRILFFSKHSIQTQGGAKTHPRIKHCSVFVRDLCVIDTKTRLYRFKNQFLGKLYKGFFYSCLDPKGFRVSIYIFCYLLWYLSMGSKIWLRYPVSIKIINFVYYGVKTLRDSSYITMEFEN